VLEEEPLPEEGNVVFVAGCRAEVPKLDDLCLFHLVYFRPGQVLQRLSGTAYYIQVIEVHLDIEKLLLITHASEQTCL